MPPMLRTIDIFIGLALIMMLVSMIVTVITQAVTNLLNSRGKHLLTGIADMLAQLHPGITRTIAEEIADTALRNPLVSNANGELGNVVHREELTKLLLELGAGDGPKRLSDQALQALQAALVADGVCRNGSPDEIRDQIREKLKGVRALALQLELAHPELSNSARARVALIQQASSQFLAKVNLTFDQTMDRVSERFTAHARYVTFFSGLSVALVLQLDTAALVSRLSTDDALRASLVNMAQTQAAPETQAGAAAPTGATGTQGAPFPLTPMDRQNIKDLMVNNVIGIPQSISDWLERWHWDNCVTKILGIILTALLLSLGAPFWYGALQNLLQLRSALATKDDQQRQERQVTGSAAAAPAQDGVVISDERGDLTVIA
jgi:hypothetical protein